MQSTIRLKRHVAPGAIPPTAMQVSGGEPAYTDFSPGGNGKNGDVYADSLTIGHGGAIAPTTLVGASRQMELQGQQTVLTGIANAKLFDLTNFKLSGGANGNVLSTAGDGNLNFIAITDLGGILGVVASAPLTPTTGTNVGTTGNPLGLTMANAGQITTGTDTVYPISSAGLRSVTGDLATLTTPAASLVAAINGVVAQIGALDLGVTTNASLSGDGTSGNQLMLAPASAIQVTAGTDNIQAITSLRLREVTGNLANLDTSPTATTLVLAINELAGHIASLQSGVTPVGTFNAATNQVTPFSGSAAVPGALPAVAAANKGWVLYVTTAGTGGPTPPAPGVALAVGDQLMSSGNVGSPWDHIAVGAAAVVASGVAIAAIPGPPAMVSTNVQDALVELNSTKIASLNLDTTAFSGNGVTTPLTIAEIDGGIY